MRTFSRPSSVIALALAAAALVACSASPAATNPGSGGQSTGGAGTVTPASAGPASTGGAAGGDFCSLFTLAEVGTFMGGTVGVDSTNTDPNSCVWFTPDGTTVLMKKVDADTCKGDESLVQSQGAGQIQGTTFVGPAIAGAVIAGTVVNGACYEVVVANGTAPKLDAIAAILQQLVQRVHA